MECHGSFREWGCQSWFRMVAFPSARRFFSGRPCSGSGGVTISAPPLSRGMHRTGLCPGRVPRRRVGQAGGSGRGFLPTVRRRLGGRVSSFVPNMTFVCPVPVRVSVSVPVQYRLQYQFQYSTGCLGQLDNGGTRSDSMKRISAQTNIGRGNRVCSLLTPSSHTGRPGVPCPDQVSPMVSRLHAICTDVSSRPERGKS